MKHLLIILFFSLFVSGCTPSFNFFVPDVVTSQQKINAALEEVSMHYGDPMSTNWELSTEWENLNEYSNEHLNQEFVPAWTIALSKALKKSELFNQAAEKKLKLLVHVKEVDVPMFAVDVTTRVTANYNLIDTSNNEILYSDLVESEETVPYSYSFIGHKRGTESINRVVRKNIRNFISNIQSYANNKGTQK